MPSFQRIWQAMPEKARPIIDENDGAFEAVRPQQCKPNTAYALVPSSTLLPGHAPVH
jgi:hypothetical protein